MPEKTSEQLDFEFNAPYLFNNNEKEQSSFHTHTKYIVILLIVIIIFLSIFLLFGLIYIGGQCCQTKRTERAEHDHHKSNNTIIYFEDENRHLISNKDCSNSSCQGTLLRDQPDKTTRNDNKADPNERMDENGIVLYV